MAAFLWNPFPVLMLTVRQFAGGKAVRVVGAISLFPVLFGAIYAFDPGIEIAEYFISEVIYRGLFIATLLPIIVLILATGALGNEIEDQTLPYLTLKPIRRLRIVVEKLAATVLVATPLVFAGLTLAYLLVYRSEAGGSEALTYLWAMLTSAFFGIVAYGSVFMLISLLIHRALLAGITYALVWESLLGRYLPGLRLVSIRHYTESIYVGLLDTETYQFIAARGDPLEDANSVAAAVITLAVVSVIAIGLSGRRLRRLNLE
ncbi:ABC transporter permease [soil metagenome]